VDPHLQELCDRGLSGQKESYIAMVAPASPILPRFEGVPPAVRSPGIMPPAGTTPDPNGAMPPKGLRGVRVG